MGTGARGRHGENVRLRAGMERSRVHARVRIRHQHTEAKHALETLPLSASVVRHVKVTLLIIILFNTIAISL